MIRLESLFVLLILTFCPDSGSTNSRCTIDINKDLPDPQPLLLNPGTNKSVLPNNPQGVVNLNQGQVLELFCTEGFETISGQKSLEASCSHNNNVKINNKSYNIHDLKCQKSSKPVTKEVGKCYKDAALIHVGYNVGKRFLKLIEICFDRQEERTLYAYARLTKANAAHQKNVDRGGWVAGKGYFSNSNVNKLYSVANQFERAKVLLGAGNAKKFVNKRVNLARGHLAPMVDFVYGVHQRATMHLLNAAPQWNTINGGNWFKIEESIRDLIEKGKIDTLDVYSGTYGTLEVNKKPVHLTVNHDGDGVMPVPMIFYKVVISRNEGVVLIMLNDPYVTQKNIKNYILCEDVSKRIHWVRKMKLEVIKGYYYACRVDDFVKVVKHLPTEVSHKGLLTD